MLTQMRAHVHGFLAKALLLFLVLTFAVWGIGDMVQGTANREAAVVGGEHISLPEFQRALQNTRRMMEANGMKGAPLQMIAPQILQQMISERLIRQHTYALGLSVNDETLARELRAIDTFRKSDGTFDVKTFQAYLAQQRITEAHFLEQLQRDIKTRVVAESLSLDDLTLPPHYLALKALAASETRDIAVITLKPAPSQEPSMEAIQAFYDQQKDLRFLNPEARTLTYATITDEEIKARIASLQMDRDAAMQEITHTIEDALAAGQSMQVALENAKLKGSLKTLAQVALGSSKDEVAARVMAYGFTLAQGETSSLQVAKPGTYFIVTVTKVTPASPKPLEEVKGEVVKALKEQTARDDAMGKAKAMAQELTTSKDWQATLKTHNLTAQTFKNVTRSGKSSLPAPLQEAVFERGLNEPAGPYVLPTGAAQLALTTAIRHERSVDFDEATKKTITDELARDTEIHFLQSLAKEYKVEVNETGIQSLMKDANE